MFGADHGANLSAGVLVGQPLENHWFPYAGFGGGWMAGFTPRDLVKPCDPPPADCSQTTSETLVYLHLRAGIGVALGTARRSLVSLDVGGWYGRHYKTGLDSVGNKIASDGPIVLPMVGLSYLFAL